MSTTTATKEDDYDDDDDDMNCEKDEICDVEGINPDLEDCSKYYLCACNSDGQWTKFHQACPHELLFNRKYSYCDFPTNVECEEKISAMSDYLLISQKDKNDTIIVPGNIGIQYVPNLFNNVIVITLTIQIYNKFFLNM